MSYFFFPKSGYEKTCEWRSYRIPKIFAEFCEEMCSGL